MSAFRLATKTVKFASDALRALPLSREVLGEAKGKKQNKNGVLLDSVFVLAPLLGLEPRTP